MIVDRRRSAPRTVTSADVTKWVGRQRGSDFDRQLRAAIPATKAMMASADWTNATPTHFLVVHRIRHEEVYGTPGVKMSEKTRLYLAKMVKLHFEGDPNTFADFVYWAWEQEEKNVTRLRANAVEMRRGMTIRDLFNDRLINGYLVFIAEEKRRAEDRGECG